VYEIHHGLDVTVSNHRFGDVSVPSKKFVFNVLEPFDVEATSLVV
jgi:hypothetical protein